MIASDRELVRALRALADSNRFRMVQEVAAAGELSCGQIHELFPLSQPTISHHLKILSEAGVLIPRADAKHRFLSVNQELLDAIGEAIAARLGSKATATESERH
jgi:DNA-binding transcriptional ArsR family regulator